MKQKPSLAFLSSQLRDLYIKCPYPLQNFLIVTNYVVNQGHDCILIALSYLSSPSQNRTQIDSEQKILISHSCSLCTTN